MIEDLAKSRNGHIRAFLVQAYVDGKIKHKPKLSLGSRLSTVDADWLVNLVAKSQNFSGAAFSGDCAEPFDHLASRNIKLIDFQDHIGRIENTKKQAISRTRYGYDDDCDENEAFNDSSTFIADLGLAEDLDGDF